LILVESLLDGLDILFEIGVFDLSSERIRFELLLFSYITGKFELKEFFTIDSLKFLDCKLLSELFSLWILSLFGIKSYLWILF